MVRLRSPLARRAGSRPHREARGLRAYRSGPRGPLRSAAAGARRHCNLFLRGLAVHYDLEAPRDARALQHNPLKAIVAPRPIGWISAMSREGKLNLAPYSFFNAVADNMV